MLLATLEGRPFRVNRAFGDMLGYREEELLRKSVFDITHPDDVEPTRQALQRLRRGEVPSIAVEKRYRHKLGHLVWGVVSVSVVRGPDGQPLHFVSQANDITDRRRVEEALSEGRNFVAAVLDLLGAGVVVLDMSGRIVRLNRAAEEFTGCTFDQVQGQYFWELLPEPVEAKRAQALFARQLAGAWPTEYEAVWLGRDGRRRVLSCSTSFLRRHGKPEYFVATSVDITARKQAEQEARQRAAELAHVLRVTTIGEMASGLAHEINQPLAAIVNYAKGCANRLRAGDGVSPEILDALEQIAGQSLRAAEIIRRLRQFVSKEPPRREVADVNGMVTEVAHLVEAEAREHRVAVQLDLGVHLPPVQVDNIQIEQVLVNLVRNGFEAMQGAGVERRELTISTSLADAGAVEVAVSDTGRGLPAANGHSVFDPFFTTKPNGLGMGLSISRTIIAAHGGQLWAMPAVQRGAVFRFSLPTAV
jgi:two-component system sensor kinase FixL